MQRAFTLVELLVVVATIAVLLALLTPAMERAIYSAELVACAARLHGLSSGGLTYATSHKRWYPYRDSLSGSDVEPNRLNVPPPYWDPPADVRPLLRNYVDINGHFNDPLSGEVEMDASHPDTAVNASYYYFFNWRFEDLVEGAGTTMNRLGDRFGWTLPDGRTNSFNVLASDWTTLQVDDHAFSSHPDSDGVLVNGRAENADATELLVGAESGVLKVTAAVWSVGGGTYLRGTVDFNYAFDDGSVTRLNEVRWDEALRREDGRGGRTARIPRAGNAGSWPDDWSDLPPIGG